MCRGVAAVLGGGGSSPPTLFDRIPHPFHQNPAAMLVPLLPPFPPFPFPKSSVVTHPAKSEQKQLPSAACWDHGRTGLCSLLLLSWEASAPDGNSELSAGWRPPSSPWELLLTRSRVRLVGTGYGTALRAPPCPPAWGTVPQPPQALPYWQLSLSPFNEAHP